MTSFNADLAAVSATLRASTVRVHDGTRGSGSGTVWNSAGLVVTNAHVVRGPSAQIEFEDGGREQARLVARDDARDLAVLQPERRRPRPVTTRPSATLRPGELVIAIGNPLGLVGAAATGIVQRRNPRWVIADVRLAPGNSGGPLADGGGRVVGINSMVAGGLGFAVPTEAVEALLEAQARPKLGIAGVPGRLPYGGRATTAFVVTHVEPDGIAERSGLALGDAIYATDAGGFTGPDAIAGALARANSVLFVRGGLRRTLLLIRPSGAGAATDAA